MNYRPYNFKELAQAIRKHGGYIITKPSDLARDIMFIASVTDEKDESGHTELSFADCGNGNTEELLKFFLWLDDNTPCGIKED